MKDARIDDQIVVDARTAWAGKSLAFMEVLIYNKRSEELLIKGNMARFLIPHETVVLM